MNRIVKYAAAVTIAGTCAVAMAAPSQAYGWHHHHHHWNSGAAIGAGIAAGALIGAAAANSAYYGPGYAAYDYAPGYGAYDYAPDYGTSNSTRCTQSPASTDYTPCENGQ